VIEARNGAEALEVAAAHTGHIDLLLTDVIMPKLNGVLLAEQMLQHQRGMAVLFMSGYVEGALLSANHPNVVLIPKPFTVDRLLEGVRAALGPSAGRVPSESLG
jgi:DNA-binding NtrC family response regulator